MYRVLSGVYSIIQNSRERDQKDLCLCPLAEVSLGLEDLFLFILPRIMFPNAITLGV